MSEGWEISDLARALLFLGATATWLGLANRKNLDALREIVALGRMRAALGRVPGVGQTRRPYPAVRIGQDTDVLTVILPRGFARMVETFAATKIMTRNDLCAGLLTKGLAIYVIGENTLLRALQDQRRQAEQHPSAT